MLFSSRISRLPFILYRILLSVDRAHHTSPHAILIPYIALTIHTIPHPAFSGQSTSHLPPCYSHPVYRSYHSYYTASCFQWTEHITPPPMLFSSRISLLPFILSCILPSVDRAHHTSPHAILIPYIALTIHTIPHPAFSGQSTSHFPSCYSHPVYRSYHSYYTASCFQWTEHITPPPMLFSSRISLLPFILYRILPSVDRAHHTSPPPPHAILIPYIALTIHTIPHPAFSGQSTSHFPPPPHAILIPYIALTIHTIPHPAFSGQSTSHLPPCYSHPVSRSYHSYFPASCLQWTEHITLPLMLFSSRISLLTFILSRILPSVDRSHHTSPHAILIPYIAVKIHSIPHPAFSGQSTSHFPPYYSHPVNRTYNSYYPASCLQWTEHITPSPHAFLIPYIALTIHTILHPAFSGQSTSHFPPPPPMLFSSRISLLPFILSCILPSVDRAHHTSPHAILIPYIALTIHTILHPAFSGQSTSHFPPYRFSSRISLLQFILSRILPSEENTSHFLQCRSHQ